MFLLHISSNCIIRNSRKKPNIKGYFQAIALNLCDLSQGRIQKIQKEGAESPTLPSNFQEMQHTAW